MIATRAARVVDHDQYSVAKPAGAPAASRPTSCTPSRSGSASSARDSASTAASDGAAS
jgi:hypothetical protein